VTLTPEEQTLRQAIHQARTSQTTIPGRDETRGVDLEGAYRIQAISGEGRLLKGYKFGLISPAKQAQMDLSTPLYGRIYHDMLLNNPASLQKFIQPKLEPEIALVLNQSVPAGADSGVAQQAIGGFFLGVDVLDSVWEGYRFSAPEVVADNTSGGGFLLGSRLISTLPGGTLRLYLNGALRTEGPIEALGNPAEQLAWLADRVGGLKAGQIIFLGSPAAAAPAEAGVLEVVDSSGYTLIAKLEE
jgi:2-oxo-3-hexenedioate decarboxylase